MSEQKIEDCISRILIRDAQKNALEFVSYLRTNEMLFERGGGYWADKFYWYVKCKNEIVCFILIGSEEKPEEKSDSWVVWSDDSDSDWFKDFPLDENMIKTAWKNVDICVKCGSCSQQGRRKTILGREFDNVCGTTMRFDDPDVDTLECMKKIFLARKKDIIKNL